MTHGTPADDASHRRTRGTTQALPDAPHHEPVGARLEPIRMEPPSTSEGLRVPRFTEGLTPLDTGALRGEMPPGVMQQDPPEQASLRAARRRATELGYLE